MHELSLASAILDSVAEETARYPGARPIRVGVRVGEIAGVDCDALAFGFEALVKDSNWGPLKLELEFCPRKQRCGACSQEFLAPNSQTTCPKCGSMETVCIGGNELDLAFIELEDA
jgi:hydrogenase nickel incorporation protein HypA/HybF